MRSRITAGDDILAEFWYGIKEVEGRDNKTLNCQLLAYNSRAEQVIGSSRRGIMSK